MVVYIPKGRESYVYDFEIDGRRFSRSCRTQSEREAEKVERIARQQAEALIKRQHEIAGPDPADLTVDSIFGKYWHARGKAAKSHATNLKVIERIVRYLGPQRLYVMIGISDVAGFIGALKELAAQHPGFKKNGTVRQANRMSGATINRHIEMWKAVHNYARDVLEAPVRPIAWGSLRQRASAERVVTMTPEDCQLIWSLLPEHAQDIVEFAVSTGLRREQVFELQWSRVNVKAREAHVRAQKRKDDDGIQIVQLNSSAIAVIARLIDDNQRAEIPRVLTGCVFNSRNFRKEWERAVRGSGVIGPKGAGDVRFHDLRHAFATWAAREGVPVQVIMKQLGHSHIKVTMKYMTVSRDDVAAGVERVPSIHTMQIGSSESHTAAPSQASHKPEKA